MRARLRGVALALLCGIVAVRALHAQVAPVTFQAQTELVTLDVIVQDREGRPVTGLSRADFVVKEDGAPQEIVSFEPFEARETPSAPEETLPPTPVVTNLAPPARRGGTFALIVDDQGLGLREAVDTREALERFVNTSLRDGDEVTLAATSGQAWWTATVPEGREDLLAIAARIKGRDPESSRGLDYLSDYEAAWIREHDNAGGILQRVIQRWTASGVCFEDRNVGNVTQPDPGCPERIKARASDVDATRKQRTRIVLATVRRTLDALATGPGRKSVLLFSRGFLDDSESSARDVAAAAREANAVLYFIDARGLQVNPGGLGVADAGGAPNPIEVGRMAFEAGVEESGGTRALADDTGGLSFRNTNDLGAAAARVAQESRSYYMIGFSPAGKKPGDWHKLKVEVDRPGVTVRTRKGYSLRVQSADKKSDARAASKSDKPAAALTAAIDSAHAADGIPLRAMVYVLGPGAKGLAHVLVAAEFDARALSFDGSGKERVARLEFGVAVTERDDGHMREANEQVLVRVPEGDAPGWRSLGRELDVPVGVAEARVVLRDPRTRAVGAVSYRFLVPSQDVLRLTTPIVTDQLEPKAPGDAHPRAAVAIHRSFLPQGRVYCEFEVLGARRDPATKAPRVTAGVDLLTKGGTLVRRSDTTPIAPDGRGRLVRLVGMGVDGLSEGDYELVITVSDAVSGENLERREPLVLARAAAAP